MAARTKYTDRVLLPPSEWSMSIAYYGRRKRSARFSWAISTPVSARDWRCGAGCRCPACRHPLLREALPACRRRGHGQMEAIGEWRRFFLFGKTVVSSFLSFPGLRRWCEGGKSPEISAMAGANIARFTRNGQFSVTGYCKTEPKGFFSKPESGRLSGDFRYSWRGVDSSVRLRGTLPADSRSRHRDGVSVGKGLEVLLGCSRVRIRFPGGFSGGVRSWTKTKDERGILLCLEKGPVFLTRGSRAQGQ